MGVNDIMIPFVESRLQHLVGHLLHEHLEGLVVANSIGPDTSSLAHEEALVNQACGGVVVH
jgi:hypothetical protein